MTGEANRFEDSMHHPIFEHPRKYTSAPQPLPFPLPFTASVISSTSISRSSQNHLIATPKLKGVLKKVMKICEKPLLELFLGAELGGVSALSLSLFIGVKRDTDVSHRSFTVLRHRPSDSESRRDSLDSWFSSMMAQRCREAAGTHAVGCSRRETSVTNTTDLLVTLYQ